MDWISILYLALKPVEIILTTIFPPDKESPAYFRRRSIYAPDDYDYDNEEEEENPKKYKVFKIFKKSYTDLNIPPCSCISIPDIKKRDRNSNFSSGNKFSKKGRAFETYGAVSPTPSTISGIASGISNTERAHGGSDDLIGASSDRTSSYEELQDGSRNRQPASLPGSTTVFTRPKGGSTSGFTNGLNGNGIFGETRGSTRTLTGGPGSNPNAYRGEITRSDTPLSRVLGDTAGNKDINSDTLATDLSEDTRAFAGNKIVDNSAFEEVHVSAGGTSKFKGNKNTFVAGSNDGTSIAPKGESADTATVRGAGGATSAIAGSRHAGAFAGALVGGASVVTGGKTTESGAHAKGLAGGTTIVSGGKSADISEFARDLGEDTDKSANTNAFAGDFGDNTNIALGDKIINFSSFPRSVGGKSSNLTEGKTADAGGLAKGFAGGTSIVMNGKSIDVSPFTRGLKGDTTTSTGSKSTDTSAFAGGLISGASIAKGSKSANISEFPGTLAGDKSFFTWGKSAGVIDHMDGKSVETGAFTEKPGSNKSANGSKSAGMSNIVVGKSAYTGAFGSISGGGGGGINSSGVSNRSSSGVTPIFTSSSGETDSYTGDYSRGVSNLASRAGGGLSHIAGGFSTGTDAATSGIVGGATNIASGAYSGIATVKGIITSVASGIAGGVSAVASGIGSITTGISNVAGAAASGITGGVGSVAGATSTVTNTAGASSRTLRDYGNVASGVGSIAAGISGGLSTVTESILQGLAVVALGIYSGLSIVADTVYSGISSVAGGSSGFLSGESGGGSSGGTRSISTQAGSMAETTGIIIFALWYIAIAYNYFIAPVVEHRRRRGCKCMRPPCSSSSNSCSSLTSEDRKTPALEKPVPAPEALIYPDSVDLKMAALEVPKKPAPEDPDDILNRFATDRVEDIIAHAKKEEPVTNPEAEIIEDAQDIISPKDDDE